MSQYSNAIALAIRMILKYGQAVTWRKLNVTISNTQPWKSTDVAPGDTSVYILFLRPNGGLSRALFHLIKGTDVPTGAPRGLMAPVAGLTPEITDVVVRNGSSLVIGAINVVAPNGEPLLYEIEFA